MICSVFIYNGFDMVRSAKDWNSNVSQPESKVCPYFMTLWSAMYQYYYQNSQQVKEWIDWQERRPRKWVRERWVQPREIPSFSWNRYKISSKDQDVFMYYFRKWKILLSFSEIYLVLEIFKRESLIRIGGILRKLCR